MRKLKGTLVLLLCLMSCTIWAQKPVAAYFFNDGSGRDELGRNNAKLSNVQLSEDRFGNKNAAVTLQGNPDSYVNFGTSKVLKPIAGSISLWVKIDQAVYKGSGVTHNPILLTHSHGGDDFNEAYFIGYHFELRKISGNTTASMLQQIYLYPSGTCYFRQWYHVVLCYDDNYAEFYLNGELQNRTAKGFRTHFLEGDSVIAGVRIGEKNNRFLSGAIDDVQFFDRVLSPAEVKRLYDAPNPNRKAVMLQWLLVGLGGVLVIVAISLGIRWRIRHVLSRKMAEAELVNKAYEQEMRVLKAQMNPHFIFNALNTIQQFIIVNENEKAQLYLTKFSRLIRRLLESNTSDNVSLREELSILEGYLEIESLRFGNVFDYSIRINEGVRPENIFIPNFLIQPFVENALWHGLLPKKGNKTLLISFEKLNEKTLSCVVEDNGVGRQNRSERPADKEKSLAIEFIRSRLELMSRIRKVSYAVRFTDKIDDEGKSAGTLVHLTIPIITRQNV